MACSCQTLKPFKIKIFDDERIVLGLDNVLFTAILADLKNDADAEEILWRRLRNYNPEIADDEEFVFKRHLMQLYKNGKKAYEAYQKNQRQAMPQK